LDERERWPSPIFPGGRRCVLLCWPFMSVHLRHQAAETTGQPTTGRGKYLALTAALLGWMFDGLEMGLFPLVARPAISDLMSTTDDKAVGRWFAVATACFLVGAATGGVLFGWLGDRIGRVRAMTLSVLTYAVFSGLCGIARSSEQIAALRFLSALGMGGEWSLGVALVMEIWPDQSRGVLAGLIGAAANVGYLAIGVLGLGLGAVGKELPGWLLSLGVSTGTVEFLVANQGWRLLMLIGAMPAFLTLFIQLFVPESHRWKKEHGLGTTSHWAARDLVGVGFGCLGAGLIIYLWAPLSEVSRLLTTPLGWPLRIVGTAIGLAVVTLGYLYPVMRFLQRAAAEAGVA